MIAPKRRLTNHALHGREEWFKRIFRDQIAEAAASSKSCSPALCWRPCS